MISTMEREDQDKILEYLNRQGMPFSRYSFIYDNKYGHMKRLGSGGGGAVYAIRSRLGDEFAVKIVGFQIPPITNPQIIKDCELEVQTQREVGKTCREVVRIEDAQVLCIKLDDDYNVIDAKELTDLPAEEGYGFFLFILMEKLQPVLTRKGVISRLKSLNEDEVIKFAIDIAKALRAAHTHPKKIIHRDVKPDNIFWDELTGVYKLGDFGIAKATEHVEKMTTGSGTGDYRAPEVRLGGSYDIRADIYSYGIMLYKLLDNDWYNQRIYNLGEALPEPKNGSDGLKKIVLKACAYLPENRYESINDLLWDLEQLQSGSISRISERKPVSAEPAAPKAAPSAPKPAVNVQLTTPGNKKAAGAPKKDPIPVPVDKSKQTPAAVPLTRGNPSDDAFAAMRKGAEPPKKDPVPVPADKPKQAPSAVPFTIKESSDDAFAAMRKGTAPPKSDPIRIPKKPLLKTRPPVSSAIILGIIGMIALFLAFIGAELLWKTSFLPNLSSWQTYVAILLSIISTIALSTLKSDDFIIPVLTPLLAFLTEGIVWTPVWLLSIGFNIYCFFGLGHNWLFLILATSLLFGSKGLLYTANLAVLVSIPLAIFRDSLPMLTPDYYWVMLILFIIGIRFGAILMYDISDFRAFFHTEDLRRGWLHFIPTIALVAAGPIVWLLSNVFDVQLPVIFEQLRLIRVALIYLAALGVEFLFEEVMYL